MILFTCDLCGIPINPETSRRFVVKLEIYAIESSLEMVPLENSTDPLELMEKIIESAEDDIAEELHKNKTERFDLCCNCHTKFKSDPLGRKMNRKIHFSSN